MTHGLPGYLKGREHKWQRDPHAAIQWFERGEREIGSSFREIMEKHHSRTVERWFPERGFHRRTERISDVWCKILRYKPIEICGTMQEKNRWFNCRNVVHMSLEQVLSMNKHARALGGNLLLNTGPLGDGSIHPQDHETLIRLGETASD